MIVYTCHIVLPRSSQWCHLLTSSTATSYNDMCSSESSRCVRRDTVARLSCAHVSLSFLFLIPRLAYVPPTTPTEQLLCLAPLRLSGGVLNRCCPGEREVGVKVMEYICLNVVSSHQCIIHVSTQRPDAVYTYIYSERSDYFHRGPSTEPCLYTWTVMRRRRERHQTAAHL
jgi:hypothetical protein